MKHYQFPNGDEAVFCDYTDLDVDDLIAFLERHRGKTINIGMAREVCIYADDSELQLDELSSFMEYDNLRGAHLSELFKVWG